MNTVNKQEIQNFSKDSDNWWDEQGPFKPLHLLNPTRLSYFNEQIREHFKIDADAPAPYKGLDIIDVGCGGGLVCEPMARLSGNVTGIDADANAIEVSKAHAEQSGLEINYEVNAPEDAAQKYDVVLALEIIEHVDDRAGFVKSVIDLCKPDGLIIFSTLNKTAKSYALGIIAAEHILRWVPQGTHHWKKFVRPSELSHLIRQNGATPHDTCGMVYNPFSSEFTLEKHKLAVNYFITCGRRQNQKAHDLGRSHQQPMYP